MSGHELGEAAWEPEARMICVYHFLYYLFRTAEVAFNLTMNNDLFWAVPYPTQYSCHHLIAILP